MKITIIIATAILASIIAVTGGYNLPMTVLISLLLIGIAMLNIAVWNHIKAVEDEKKLKEVLRETLMQDIRAKEKELFKRDRKIKDTKTIKKIAKE